MIYRALDIEHKWPKHKPWNANLIPNRLQELAKRGVYFDDRVIN